MFLVGLTGSIASGKSTVSQMLADLGCVIIDADKLAREVVEPGKPAWKQIKQHFGPEVFNEDGSLNRDKMGQIVFSDEVKRRLLNSITHPQIQKTIRWHIAANAMRGCQFVVLDLPLLFETSSKLIPYFSFIVVVSCDEDIQLKRLMQRNNYSKVEALQRINAQMPLADKCDRATHVIDNSRSRADTQEQVRQFCEELRASKKHWQSRLILSTFLSTAALLGVFTYKMILSLIS